MDYTILDFVQDLFDSCSVAPETIDLETANQDLSNFKSAGFELPEGITPEAYAEAWNDLVNSMKE